MKVKARPPAAPASKQAAVAPATNRLPSKFCPLPTHLSSNRWHPGDIAARARAAAKEAEEKVLAEHEEQLRKEEEERRMEEKKAALARAAKAKADKAAREKQAALDKEAAREREAARVREAARSKHAARDTDAAGKQSGSHGEAKNASAPQMPDGKGKTKGKGKATATARRAGKGKERARSDEEYDPSEEDEDEEGQASGEDQGNDDDDAKNMAQWMEAVHYAQSAGMPRWAGAIAERVFQLDAAQTRLEDTFIPKIERSNERLSRVRGRYDGVDRRLEELEATVGELVDRQAQFEKEIRKRVEKLEERIDSRIERVRAEWREAHWSQGGWLLDRLETYGARMNRWHDRFAQLEALIGATVPDRADFCVQLPEPAPTVTRLGPFSDDGDSVEHLQATWVHDEWIEQQRSRTSRPQVSEVEPEDEAMREMTPRPRRAAPLPAMPVPLPQIPQDPVASVRAASVAPAASTALPPTTMAPQSGDAAPLPPMAIPLPQTPQEPEVTIRAANVAPVTSSVLPPPPMPPQPDADSHHSQGQQDDVQVQEDPVDPPMDVQGAEMDVRSDSGLPLNTPEPPVGQAAVPDVNAVVVVPEVKVIPPTPVSSQDSVAPPTGSGQDVEMSAPGEHDIPAATATADGTSSPTSEGMIGNVVPPGAGDIAKAPHGDTGGNASAEMGSVTRPEPLPMPEPADSGLTRQLHVGAARGRGRGRGAGNSRRTPSPGSPAKTRSRSASGSK